MKITEAARVFSSAMFDCLPLLPGRHTVISCPDCKIRMTVIGVVMHLNDQHLWPRENIADWLDSLDIDDELAFKEGQ